MSRPVRQRRPPLDQHGPVLVAGAHIENQPAQQPDLPGGNALEAQNEDEERPNELPAARSRGQPIARRGARGRGRGRRPQPAAQPARRGDDIEREDEIWGGVNQEEDRGATPEANEAERPPTPLADFRRRLQLDNPIIDPRAQEEFGKLPFKNPMLSKSHHASIHPIAYHRCRIPGAVKNRNMALRSPSNHKELRFSSISRCMPGHSFQNAVIQTKNESLNEAVMKASNIFLTAPSFTENDL